MHHNVTRALFDFFPPENKNDFFPSYLYMKHLEHYIYQVFLNSGLPAIEPAEKLPEEIEEMVAAYAQITAEAAPSAETNTYHAKIVKLADAIKLVSQKQHLDLKVPEKVVPFKTAKDVILLNPESIAVGSCVCRRMQEKPCLPPPMEVCLFVGDPWSSFLADQNPLFRKISQDEAINVLEFSHQKGFVHCAYFKKEMGDRFVAICNCCSCCCVGVRMWNLLEGAVPFLAPSGYVAQVSDECNACAACVDGVCPFVALSLDEAEERAVVNLVKCMGCGVCEDVCPIGAISLRPEPSKGEPLDLDELKLQAKAP